MWCVLVTFALCCIVYLTLYCTIITRLYTILTGALLWSTEKLQTIQVSGSFSFKADIFRMAERYKTSRWEAGHTLYGRSTHLLKVWTPFLVFFLAAPLTPVFLGFPDSSVGKDSACNVGNLGLIPGLGRSPEEGKGYPLQYSSLENSMDCSPWGHKELATTEWLSDSMQHLSSSTRDRVLATGLSREVLKIWTTFYLHLIRN